MTSALHVVRSSSTPAFASSALACFTAWRMAYLFIYFFKSFPIQDPIHRQSRHQCGLDSVRFCCRFLSSLFLLLLFQSDDCYRRKALGSTWWDRRIQHKHRFICQNLLFILSAHKGITLARIYLFNKVSAVAKCCGLVTLRQVRLG